MTRLYEIAALAYGLFAMTLLTGVAVWLGDRSAALLMIGCVCAAYVCQCATAYFVVAPETMFFGRVGYVSWCVSILFALAAIGHMVLA